MNLTEQQAHEIGVLAHDTATSKEQRLANCSTMGLMGYMMSYFPHYFTVPSAPMHYQIAHAVEDPSAKLVILSAFRGSAKSTLGNTGYASFAGIFEKYHFIVIISATDILAAQHMYNVKAEFEDNVWLLHDFPSLHVVNSDQPIDLNRGQGQRKWSSLDFMLNNGVRYMGKSTGQKIRGLRYRQYRPELIIIDDIETIDNVRTKESRDKVWTYLTTEVFPAADMLKSKVVFIGNYLHNDSAIARLSNQVTLGHRKGTLIRVPILEGEKINWPGMFPTMEEIELKRAEVSDEGAWRREFMLEALSSEEKIITVTKRIDYIPEVDSVVIGIDPAMTDRDDREGAESAVNILCHKKGGGYFQYKSVAGRWGDLTALCERIAAEYKHVVSQFRMAPLKVLVEDVQAQKWLADNLRKHYEIPAEGVRPPTDKRSRLKGVSNVVNTGLVEFYDTLDSGNNELITQMEWFGAESLKDRVDAFVYCLWWYTACQNQVKVVMGAQEIPQATRPLPGATGQETKESSEEQMQRYLLYGHL